MDGLDGSSAEIRVFLLGYPMVRCGNEEVPLDSAKIRGLLAYLLMHPGEVLAREDLAFLFWPLQDAFHARQNLRQALYRLRRALGPVTGWWVTPETVEWEPRGQIWVDVWAFSAWAQQVEKHAHRKYGACPCCHRRYEQILALYRGEFLHGLQLPDAHTFASWVMEQRAFFRQWALRSVHEVVRYHYLLGEYDKAETWCRTWLRWDRWSEEAYGYLIRSLALQDRRGEALQAYRAYEAMMREELKAEPSEDARQLSYDLQQGLLTPTTPWKSESLPRSSFPMFGRDKEVEEALYRLAEPRTRLVVLTGPGGIGKTRLAQEVARRARSLFPDGVYWVRMEGVRDAQSLLQTLQTQLTPYLDVGLTLEDAIQRWSTRRMLFVLDNVEATSEVVAKWIQDLLHWTDEVVLLVTSREPLNLVLEQVIPLEGLDYPRLEDEPLTPEMALRFPAVAMLEDRIRRSAPRFELDAQSLPAVLEIIRFTRGLPLALELAAGRAALVSCQEVARCLEEAVLDLRTLYRDQPPSHTSLRVLLEGVWQALEPEERTWLKSVALFDGPFDVEMARVIARVPFYAMERLTHRNFLSVLTLEGGELRWEVHPVMRAFLREHSRAQADFQRAWHHRARHWILHLLPHLDVNLSQDLLRLAAVRSVFHQLLEELIHHPALDEVFPLISGIAAWYRHHGWLKQGYAYFSRWLNELTGRPPSPARRRLEGLLHRQRGLFAYLMGLAEKALQDLQAALDRLEAFPDLQGERGRALQALASVFDLQGDLQRAEDVEYQALYLFHDQMKRAEASGEDADVYWVDIANSMNNLGVLAFHRGDWASATQRYQEAVHLYRQQGALPFLANTLGNLSMALLVQGRWQEARAAAEEALQVSCEIQAHRPVCVALVNLGFIALEQGQWGTAHLYFRRALYRIQQAHLPELGVEALIGLGKVLHALGRHEDARKTFRQALEQAERFHLCYPAAQALVAFVETLLQQEAFEEALPLLRQAWARVMEKGFQSLEIRLFLQVAHWWYRHGAYEQAWRLLCWLETQALMPLDQRDLQTLKACVAKTLSEEQRTRAAVHGKQVDRKEWMNTFMDTLNIPLAPSARDGL